MCLGKVMCIIFLNKSQKTVMRVFFMAGNQKTALVFRGFRLIKEGKPSQNKAGNKIQHNLLPGIGRIKPRRIFKNSPRN